MKVGTNTKREELNVLKEGEGVAIECQFSDLKVKRPIAEWK